MNYLDYKFEDSQDFINTWDELPLWSAKFAFLLLENIELKANISVLDIGSGAGTPLIELAERLGNTCKCYGLDTWKNANIRAKQKIENYNITNVEIIESSAENIPLADNSIDMIVSNLGLNNFEKVDLVLQECKRVMKPNASIYISTNIYGHWKEFYEVFYQSLDQLGLEEEKIKLKSEEMHRGTLDSISKLFIDNGFKIENIIQENFTMNFLDGSAFLNHHFVKLGWLSSWKNIIQDENLQEVFRCLENNLNNYSHINKGLKLTVPVLFIQAKL